MKNILYTLLAGVMALGSCSKADDMPTAPQGESTTFTLSVEQSQTPARAKSATRAASTVTPTRYIMEVWSEDGTKAENLFENGTKNHAEITSGASFTVTLDKTKAYTCLFWADPGADNTSGAFNAASLKAISLNAGKDVTEACHAKVAVAKGRNPAVAVTLKRAVAKITLVETATVKTDANLALELSNIYPTFSVLDAQATGTAAGWTKTIQPSATTGTIATLYFFAKADKELSDLKFTYAGAAEKTVSSIPVQQNFATNIKGEYSNVSSFTFTVTADDAWGTPDNEVELQTLHAKGLDGEGMLYVSPQGNMQQVELVMPAGLTENDYVSMNVTVTGEGGKSSKNLTRALKINVPWMGLEVRDVMFNEATGLIIANPILYIKPTPEAPLYSTATVAATLVTKTYTINYSFTVKAMSDAKFDYYPDATNPVGVVYRVKTETQPGLLVSVDEATGKNWDSAQQWTSKNTLPGDMKWHCPTKDELSALYNVWSSDQESFNSKLTKAKGTGISKTTYWSSTESSSNGLDYFAFNVDFYNGSPYDCTMSNANNRVRVVSAF